MAHTPFKIQEDDQQISGQHFINVSCLISHQLISFTLPAIYTKLNNSLMSHYSVSNESV